MRSRELPSDNLTIVATKLSIQSYKRLLEHCVNSRRTVGGVIADAINVYLNLHETLHNVKKNGEDN